MASKESVVVNEEGKVAAIATATETARALSQKLNQDALLADMERKYLMLQKERDELSRTCSSTQGQLTAVQSELSTVQDKVREKDSELHSTKSKLESLQTQEIYFNERIDRMNVESDALREEISRLSKTNQDLKTEFSEMQTKSSLSTYSAAPLQYQVSRQQIELESLTSHSRWLEDQLASSNEQLVVLKTKHSKYQLESKSTEDSIKQERDDLVSELSSLRNKHERASSKITFLEADIRDKEKDHAGAIETLQQEIDMERKMTSLTKEKVKRMEEKLNDTNRQMQSMKKMAEKASSGAQTQLMKLRSELEEKYENALTLAKNKHEESLHELTHELEVMKGEKIKLEESFLTRKEGFSRRPLLTLPSSGTAEQLSLTDMYTKLADVEDELRVEKEDKKRLELILKRVQLDVEAKAPLLKQQRKEYEVAVGQNQVLKARLKDALQEAEASQDEIQKLDSEVNQYQKECRELRGENTDLAKQIQALLKQEADKTGLIEFTSIEEMQNQNQRLVLENRRLLDSVQEMQTTIDTDTLQQKYQQAEEELNELRTERERQAVLVSGIVQQRDLYRALLSKTNAELPDDSNALVSLKEQTNKWTETENQNKQMVEKIAKLEASLVTESNLKIGLEERLLRMDSHTGELTETMDTLQKELALAHGSKARSDADVSFYKNKCDRLDETIANQKEHLSRLSDRINEINKVNEGLQLSLTQTRSENIKFENNSKMLEGKLRLVETQLETARLAETRLTEDANSLRMELSKQGSLLQSMQKIETTLSAHSADERKRLEEELKETKSTLTAERKQFQIDLHEWKNKVSDMEIKVTQVTKTNEVGQADLSDVKAKLAEAEASCQVLNDKCSTLEKSLNAAKIRLGDPDADLSGQDKAEILSEELKSTKSELGILQGKVESYKELAKSSDNQFKELSEATEIYKKETSIEIEKLKEELTKATKTAEVKQEALDEISKDLDTSRSEQERISNELKSQLVAVKSELEVATQNKETSDSHVKSLTEEILVYKADAKAATDNYERELCIHAQARVSLQKARDEIETNKLQRQSAETQFEHLKNDFAKERENYIDSNEKLQALVKTTETRLHEAKEQNNILLNQITNLSKTVQDYQSEKIMEAASHSKVSTNLQEEGENESDEVSTLKKDVSELREIVRYMKSESDVNESQLDLARRAVEREKSSSEITKRSLDEARAELELLRKSSDQNKKEDSLLEMSERLKQADEQLLLLRESNKLLREESDKIKAELNKAIQEAGETKASFEPNEQKCRELEVTKAELEAEKASLVREVDAWKSRVQSLISKFHQIDPEEHKKALDDVEKITKQYNALKTAKEQADKESLGAKSILAKLNKEISQLKASLDTSRKDLAKETSEKEQIAKSQKENNMVTRKENDELKTKLKNAETALTSSQTELTGASKRMENLTKMLRKYKQIVADLKSENQKAIDNEQEAKKELAKEKLTVKKLTEQQEIQAKESDSKNNNLGVDENESDPHVSSTKRENEETVKQPTVKTAKTDESHGVNADVLSTAKSSEESKTEKMDVPTIPKGGFNFAPSKASKVSPLTNSEDKTNNSATADNPAVQTNSKTTCSSSVTGVTEEKPDSAPNETPVTVSKSTDQSTKEENLRAKLMKRKRELEAELKKKADDEKAISEPQVKRLDTGDKSVEKEVPVTSVEKTSPSDVKSTGIDETQKIEANHLLNEKTQVESENKSIDISSQSKEQNKKEESDTKVESKSETFLNLQPPGKGNSTTFVFGKSSNIQLPIPTAKSSPGPPPMGVFGQNPFSASVSETEGSESNKKRPLTSEGENPQSKLLRTDEPNVKDTAQPNNQENENTEEGEVMD